MAYADLDTIFTPGAGVAVTTTVWNQLHDNLDYLYDRGPYICTSATRPGSPFEGQQIFETDTNKLLTYDGANWWTIGIAGNGTTAFNGTAVVQSGAVTHSVDVSEYRIISGYCEWTFQVTITGSGSAGNAVTITPPVTAAASARVVGAGIITDSSGSTIDSGVWFLISTTTIGLLASEGTNNYWGATPSIALASGDTLRGQISYKVASAA